MYGEDYNNDGWVEETTGDRRRFDFVGNNKDLDDDGDLYLDVDEIAVGTDPLDKESYPGSTYRDQDGDGVSDRYELANNTIQKIGILMETELVTDGNIQHHVTKIIEIIKYLLRFQVLMLLLVTTPIILLYILMACPIMIELKFHIMFLQQLMALNY